MRGTRTKLLKSDRRQSSSQNVWSSGYNEATNYFLALPRHSTRIEHTGYRSRGVCHLEHLYTVQLGGVDSSFRFTKAALLVRLELIGQFAWRRDTAHATSSLRSMVCNTIALFIRLKEFFIIFAIGVFASRCGMVSFDSNYKNHVNTNQRRQLVRILRGLCFTECTIDRLFL